MRIGSRWRAGEAPPAGLPAAFVAAIGTAEVPDGWWTLTWLEGRPIAEHDSGERLALGPDGAVRSGPDAGIDPALDPSLDDEDDWLA